MKIILYKILCYKAYHFAKKCFDIKVTAKKYTAEYENISFR
jgi:hypothetical protein